MRTVSQSCVVISSIFISPSMSPQGQTVDEKKKDIHNEREKKKRDLVMSKAQDGDSSLSIHCTQEENNSL